MKENEPIHNEWYEWDDEEGPLASDPSEKTREEWVEIERGPDQEPAAKAKLPHSLRFMSFHNDNPQVYVELVRLARQAKSQGYQHFGIGMLWEVMRWNMIIQVQDANTIGLKLNNDYRSRYARLIMDHEPDLAGFFETRTLKTG